MIGLGFGIFLTASFTVVDLTFDDLRLELLEEFEDSCDAMTAPPTALTVSELTFKLDGSDDDCINAGRENPQTSAAAAKLRMKSKVQD